MFFKNETQQENQIQQSDTKIQAIEIELNHLEREVNELFDLMDVTPEQLSAFIENKENFTDEHWSELHNQRKLMDERLHRTQTNIRNPLKTKRSYNNLHVGRHWLFVK
jgi:hypothetical protein